MTQKHFVVTKRNIKVHGTEKGVVNFSWWVVEGISKERLSPSSFILLRLFWLQRIKFHFRKAKAKVEIIIIRLQGRSWNSRAGRPVGFGRC